MFVDDIRNDFYNVIQGNKCLLLVNFDVDAICACKILQTLLKNDNVMYTLVPVQGIQDVVRAYEENSEEMKFVIMINCCGTLDIVEILQPPEDIVFFILDSHRPYDLCNIYSEGQVRILGKPDEDDEIPEYNDVFHDETSDEEEANNSEEDEESMSRKRRRLNEEDLLKRSERRKWEEKRREILFNYIQYSKYGKSSAVVIYDMAYKMSKDNIDMAWWAIVGSTEQFILQKIESSVNVSDAGYLHGAVTRLSRRAGVEADKQQQSAVKVLYDKDIQLALYRHWTVEASIKHSTATAVSLRLWSVRGEKKLRELLVEMGLPLAQSKQKFATMDLALRQEFCETIEKFAPKYKFDNIVGASFTMQHGYKFKYCANDIVYAMIALLESSNKDRSPRHCFLDAMDCLSRIKKDVLDRGIEKAKTMLMTIFRVAQAILEMKQVMNAGSFIYVTIPDGTADSKLFTHPHTLMMLGQFILRAYVDSSRNRLARTWPLIATSTYDEEEETCLLVGIPPLCEDPPRSLFGRAFEEVAKKTNSFLDPDYFDTTIVRLKTEERPKFFDALAALLAS